MAARFARSDPSRRTFDGIVFDSIKEAKRYAELKLLERAGEIRGLERQPIFPVKIKGKPFCTYKADFAYRRGSWKNPILVIEDVKSTGTAKDEAYRLRKKAAELYYGIKITEVLA